MKHFILAILSFLILGCGDSAPKTKEWQTIQSRKSCLPNAHGFAQSYKVNHGLKDYFWSRILIVKLGGKCHSIVMYQVENQLFIYDNEEGTFVFSQDLGLKDRPYEAGCLYTKELLDDAFFVEESWINRSNNHYNKK